MTRSRRVVAWRRRGEVAVESRKLPEGPSPGSVRVAVDWCGLCGSDLLEYLEGPVVIPTGHPDGGVSVVLGHEFVGTVAAVGVGVDAPRCGDVVAVDTLLRCGECHYCRAGSFNLCPRLGVVGLTVDGGFAETVDVPAYMCYPVDPGIDRDTIALAEPLAVAVRALRKVGAGPQQPLAIVGCGSIGLLCVLAARHAGIKRILAVDVVAGRREAAVRAGASEVAERLPELASDAGPWSLVDCTGSATVVADLVRRGPAGSRVGLVGVTPGNVELPLKEVLDKELELVGSLSHDARDFRDAIDLLAAPSFDADWLITQRIQLEDLPTTIARLASGGDSAQLKVIVTPNHRTPPWTS